MKVKDLFSLVLADPQVSLPRTIQANESFGRMISQLSFILSNRIADTVTINSLMRAQHQVIEHLLTSEKETDWLANLSQTVAQWSTAELFLDLVGLTTTTFFRESFLGEEEIDQIKNGSLTIGDLLQKKPHAFIAPILRSIKPTKH